MIICVRSKESFDNPLPEVNNMTETIDGSQVPDEQSESPKTAVASLNNIENAIIYLSLCLFSVFLVGFCLFGANDILSEYGNSQDEIQILLGFFLLLGSLLFIYAAAYLFVYFVRSMINLSQEISSKQFREAPHNPDPDLDPERATSV
jgi:hypothetical protein